MEQQKMTVVMNDGLRADIVKRAEGVIFQNNFHSIKEIMFSYLLKDFQDERNIYSDAIARFTVKPKKQKQDVSN